MKDSIFLRDAAFYLIECGLKTDGLVRADKTTVIEFDGVKFGFSLDFRESVGQVDSNEVFIGGLVVANQPSWTFAVSFLITTTAAVDIKKIELEGDEQSFITWLVHHRMSSPPRK